MDPERVRAYLQVACAGLGFDIGEVWWTSNENGSSTVAAIGGWIESVGVSSSYFPWFIRKSECYLRAAIIPKKLTPACDTQLFVCQVLIGRIVSCIHILRRSSEMLFCYLEFQYRENSKAHHHLIFKNVRRNAHNIMIFSTPCLQRNQVTKMARWSKSMLHRGRSIALYSYIRPNRTRIDARSW
jgi:hypothetical protein